MGGLRSQFAREIIGAPLTTAASRERALTLALPGDPLSATGGYEYDRRMLDGFRRLGWATQLLQLDSSFPMPSEQALLDAQRQFSSLPADSLVLIDGLALGAMPEIVHAHTNRLRMIGLVHHPLASETGLASELVSRLFESERRALAAMQLVVVTSQRTAEALSAYGVAAHRIVVVEPGVDQPIGAMEAREQSVVDSSSAVRMLCVATITPRKGHDVLVEALASLTDLNWTLTCVGSVERHPATVSALKVQIDAAGLSKRVVLTGELDEAALDQHFRNADVFVLATRFEGYGMVIAQAAAYGLPIVSTRTGAIAALVPANAGVLVEPGDCNALRSALSRVLSSSDLRRQLAAGAYTAGTNLASWSVASERLSNVLAGVAQTHDIKAQR